MTAGAPSHDGRATARPWRAMQRLSSRTSLRVKLVAVLFTLVTVALVVISCVGTSILRGYLLGQTQVGNWIQASGGSPGAARARGVNVERTKTGLFMLTSVLAALAGIISSIRTSAANPNSGTGYELEVIAMVVIGGTALSGGRGTIVGTVLGVFILRVMRNGIVLVGVPGLAYNIFIGAIILGMMALHSQLERRQQAA